MRLHLLVIYGLGTGVGWACSGTHEPAKEHPVAVSKPVAKPPLLLDVPSVLGASIDELARRLGPMHPVPDHFAGPSVKAQQPSGLEFDSAGVFRHHGLTLVATFSTRTRQVSDLLVVGKEEKLLMQQTRLQDDASNYVLLPAFEMNNSSRFLGLRVIAITALN